MSEPLEDRLRHALDLLTADPPSAPPLRSTGRTAPRRLPGLVALAAVVITGAVVLPLLDRTTDDLLRQVTVAPQPLPDPPPTATFPRTVYPDAPAIATAPVPRASAAFAYSHNGRLTWFVVNGADGTVRVAADLLAGRSFESGGGALSPDGRRLAYSVITQREGDGPPVTPQIVTVDLTTGAETRYAANAFMRPGAWSPDGRRLAWIDAGTTLILAEADGRPVLSVPVGAGRSRVVWSPAGDRLVVAGCPVAETCPPIFVDAGDVATRELAVPMSNRVVWRPDGRSIVDPLAVGVTFVHADGSGGRGYATHSLQPVDRPFSPDGRRMVLLPPASGPSSYAAVAALSGDGRPFTELSDPEEVSRVLGWKGNDALIVAREEPGEIVLYAVPVDGSARRRLFSVAIRSEDFGGYNVLLADWFTRA